MAKVKGPLMSLDARGQIGKALVFMGWKGLQDVRQHVVPANPKSTQQTTQRGYVTTAVGLWHSVAFNTADKTAFTEWAAAAASPMSGVNKFVSAVVLALKAAHTWNSIYGLVVSDIEAETFHIAATGKTGDTYTGKIGLTPSTMNTTFEVTNTDGALAADPDTLVANTVYYCYIDDTTASEDARTGIIRVKTAAA